MKLAVITLLSLLTLTGVADAGEQAESNPFTAPIENPFVGPANPFVGTQPTTTLDVDKTRKSTIEAPTQQNNNPTGQISDQEFDGLIQRGGR